MCPVQYFCVHRLPSKFCFAIRTICCSIASECTGAADDDVDEADVANDEELILEEEDPTLEEVNEETALEDSERPASDSTHMPPQSAPPLLGSHVSEASSTHVFPLGQAIPAMPPQNTEAGEDEERAIGSSLIFVTSMIVPLPSTVGCTEPKTSTSSPTYGSRLRLLDASKSTLPFFSVSLCVPCIAIDTSRRPTFPVYVTFEVTGMAAVELVVSEGNELYVSSGVSFGCELQETSSDVQAKSGTIILAIRMEGSEECRDQKSGHMVFLFVTKIQPCSYSLFCLFSLAYRHVHTSSAYFKEIF